MIAARGSSAAAATVRRERAVHGHGERFEQDRSAASATVCFLPADAAEAATARADVNQPGRRDRDRLARDELDRSAAATRISIAGATRGAADERNDLRIAIHGSTGRRRAVLGAARPANTAI